MASRRRHPRHLVRRGFAWCVTVLRWLVVLGWVAAAVAAMHYLPSLSSATTGGGLTSFIPPHSAAIATEKSSDLEFGTPLLSRTALVQRDPAGLPRSVQLRVVTAAADLDRHHPRDLAGIAGAEPVVNTAGLLPFSREQGTTAVTYLIFAPGVQGGSQITLANRYAHHYFWRLPDHGSVIGVTGLSAGRVAQNEEILAKMPWVEAAAVLVVVLVIGLQFRSLLAPALTIVSAGVAYEITLRVTAWAGQRAGIAVPTELEPVIVVLLLGVVTDYSVFFLAGTRERLAAGDRPKDAVRHALVRNAPWVLGAGLAVTAGATVLLVARMSIFHALGPGMALTVLVGLAVSLTLLPAMLAITGRAAYWPRIPSGVEKGPDGSGAAGVVRGGWRAGLLRLLSFRPVAGVMAAAILVGLGFAGWQLTHAKIGLSIIDGLPRGSEAHASAAAAEKGFAAGIVSPTLVVVNGPSVANRLGALTHFERLLARQPGIAGVLGPAQVPVSHPAGVFLAADGNGARFAVVLDAPALNWTALDTVRGLERALPGLASRSGLSGARIGVAGDSAIAAEIVDLTEGDILRVTLAALAVDLLILLLFLRAPLASLYLLVADVAGLAASLGLSTLVLNRLLGYGQFTFYVPYAAAVLLIAFGSDYNIFLVGRIWDASYDRELPEAVASTAPQASRAITIAGVSLACSFATLAIVPLVPFREFALVMVIGVLLEVFVVRPVLVPALILLFGRAGNWPRRRIRPRPAEMDRDTVHV
ncbi:MAG: MMPL family transporter, partial [Nocardioidaceae bacterium]